MGISELTSRDAVLKAIRECDELGRAEFLRRHGFGPARGYVLVHNGSEYDSKAIAGVAYGYQFPTRGKRYAAQFTGGAQTVAPVLRALGFEVRGPTSTVPRSARSPSPEVEPGRTYSWDELGALFDFSPDYLSVAGGMLSRPELDSLLVVTHPGGGRSFDYKDYWDGDDLIYTGRGQYGNQRLDGPNRDVAENRRRIHVFEHVGARQLVFRGFARCVDVWPDVGDDKNNRPRRIYRFRLRLGSAGGPQDGERPPRQWAAPERRPRQFDRTRPPRPPRGSGRRVSQAEQLAKLEKATAGHHALLASLDVALEEAGWKEIAEVPAAVDLWARPPGAKEPRVIFEAKTVGGRNEMPRLRAALAQLLEYRFFYGDETDRLCVVTNRRISDERIRFLRAMGVDAIWLDGIAFVTRGVGQIPALASFVGS